MSETTERPQLLTALLEAVRSPASPAASINFHVAPGATVIIYTQPPEAGATALPATPLRAP